jgi:hypothetical protein
MTARRGASDAQGASAAEPEPGASRLTRYKFLGDLIASGVTDVDTLADASGLRRFEVEAELQQRAFAAARRAKPKQERRWKPRFFRRPVSE